MKPCDAPQPPPTPPRPPSSPLEPSPVAKRVLVPAWEYLRPPPTPVTPVTPQGVVDMGRSGDKVSAQQRASAFAFIWRSLDADFVGVRPVGAPEPSEALASDLMHARAKILLSDDETAAQLKALGCKHVDDVVNSVLMAPSGPLSLPWPSSHPRLAALVAADTCTRATPLGMRAAQPRGVVCVRRRQDPLPASSPRDIQRVLARSWRLRAHARQRCARPRSLRSRCALRARLL